MDNNKKKSTLIWLSVAAMFAALTTVLTFFPKIPIPGTSSGYVHLGDSIIYLAASMLPLPYAMAAGAVGGTLADIISGGAAWAPWTFFIKALLALAFTRKNEKTLCKRNFIAPVFALVITVGGYFVAEAVMYSAAAALASIIWNVAQAVASAVAYYVIGAALDKAGLKHKLTKNL